MRALLPHTPPPRTAPSPAVLPVSEGAATGLNDGDDDEPPARDDDEPSALSDGDDAMDCGVASCAPASSSWSKAWPLERAAASASPEQGSQDGTDATEGAAFIDKHAGRLTGAEGDGGSVFRLQPPGSGQIPGGRPPVRVSTTSNNFVAAAAVGSRSTIA